MDDDAEYDQCLTEASLMQTGSQLRHLFVSLIKECTPTDPAALWEKFKIHICDDLKWFLQRGLVPHATDNDALDYGLYLISKDLSYSGIHLQTIEGMPLPDFNRWSELEGNELIAQQLAFDVTEQRQIANTRIPQLNDGQRDAFEAIVNAVLSNNPQIFFLHGPAGTGKTFCYNTLCYRLRADKKIVVCVASSGIASLLLLGGRTAHSTFKIPIELFEGKACNIKKQSALGDLIHRIDLIIWDEVPMQDCFCQEAVDISLQDIRNDERPFGGITVVFGGDF